MAPALSDLLEQLAGDLGPHGAGEAAGAPGQREVVVPPEDGAVAPGEAAAAAAAARAGRRLVIEQHAAQRVDGAGVVAHPLQLGELFPHRADEPPLVGVVVQPCQGPGRQGGLGSRRAGRHGGLTGRAA